MIRQLLKTNEDWSPTIIRIMLGVVLFPHGAQKLLGWFGGYGFNGTMEFFTGTVGLPWIIGFLVILVEFFVPLLLIVGLFTKLGAVSIFGLFTGIILTSHIQYGFFMNWYGNQAGEGFEYHLLVLAMAVTLVLSGGGKMSYDRYLFKNLDLN